MAAPADANRAAVATPHRRRSLGWLRALLSVGLLGWLGVSMDWRQLGQLSLHLHWGWVLGALLLQVTNRFLTTSKWRILLRAKGLAYPYSYLLRVVWTSNFFGQFLPSAVGGDNVRMLTIAYRSKRAPEAISTVLVERLTGTVSLAALALVGGCWSYQRWGRGDVLLALTVPVAILLVGLLMLWTKTGSRISQLILERLPRLPGSAFLGKIHEAVRAYRYALRPVAGALSISGMVQVNRVILTYCLARALGVPLLIGEAFVLIPSIFFIAMLPITVSGLGLQEGAFVVLLRLAGVHTSAAFGLSLLSRVVALCSNLPGAAFLLWRDHEGGHPAHAPARPAEAAPLTVLHLTDKLGYDGRLHGVGRLFANVIPALHTAGVRVVPCVFRERHGLDQRLREQGLAVHNLSRGKWNPWAVVDLCRLVRAERVTLLHLHGYGATTLGRIVGWLTGVPCVIHQHDVDRRFPWYVGWLDCCLAAGTAGAIAVSQEVNTFCVARRHVKADRVVVLPNAVPEAAFQQPEGPEAARTARAALGLPATGRLIGSVTRFREEKGTSYLIEGFAQLRREMPEAMLVLAGDGPERDALEALVRDLGVEDRVRFLGFQDNVADVLRALDLFVLPSVTEGSPLALLEAMAAGKPIVATAVGGMREVISHGVNGLLVPSRDAAALADAMREALRDPAHAHSLGQAARETVANTFSVTRYAARLVAAYRALGIGAAQPRNLRDVKRRPTRVLWVADKVGTGDRPNGIGRYYLSVLPVLHDVEVLPMVLRSTNGLAAHFTACGVPLRELRHGRFDLRTLWSLVRIIRREQVDLLHLHGYGASAFGRVAGWLTGRPVIVHQHDEKEGVPRYAVVIDRVLAGRARWTIAVSESVGQFCRQARSVPDDQIVVWHNGVAIPDQTLAADRREAIRRTWRIPDGHQVVGTVSELTIARGDRWFITAAARVLAARPDTTFVIIGDGPERALLESRAARLGIADRMRFLGFRPDASRLLGAMDCFVLPSVTEGSSLVLLEAMAAGLPIIATAVGGTQEVLRHGETGWLVSPRDPRALGDGLIAVLADAALRARLGTQAAAAGRRYDVRRYADQLTSLYQETVAAGPREPHAVRSPLRQKVRTFLRYSLVGVTGGTLHFSFLWLLVERAHWPVLVATTVGFVAAVINNFLLNRAWTFRSTERNIRLQATRFLTVSLCGLGLNAVGMALLVSWWAWPYLWGQAATTMLVWWWNFLANTYWTFQPIRFSLPRRVAAPPRYDLSVVIPAYDEERRLPQTLEAITAYLRERQLRAELIVVDDGSTDRTLELVTQMAVDGPDIRLVSHHLNRGKGASVREGFLAAQGAYVLMVDADNSIPIESLDKLWPQRGESRILLGSRYVEGRRRDPKVTQIRYWVGRVSNWLIQWVLLPEIHDTQCGFKLFSAPAAKALAARQRVMRFGFDMELLAIAKALGLEVREIGVRWTPVPGSRVRPIRDAWRALGDLIMIKSNFWSGYYHTQQSIEAEGIAGEQATTQAAVVQRRAV